MLISFINWLSKRGVKDEMPVSLQKSLILMNRLCFGGLFATSIIGNVLYWIFNFKPAGLSIFAIFTVLFLGLVFNHFGKTNTSRFLLSTLPAVFVLSGSIYSKVHGISGSTIFYLVPRLGIILTLSFPIFLFGAAKPKFRILGAIVPLICFVFYDQINNFFGIYFKDLPLITSEYPAFILITSIIIIIFTIGINNIHQINSIYELKIQEQRERIEGQRDELIHLVEEISTQRDAFAELNQNMTASIDYASRIQKAMLSHESEIKEVLPNSFIFYVPKDIVSGDFYWFHYLDEKIILAAVDCTGHGVPGAFMSMIGNDLLNQIVIEKEIFEPDIILNELHKGIRKSLRQDDKSETKDGMDISLVEIDLQLRTVSFAGAKNPLIYYINGEKKIIKGDNMPIGGEQLETERIFTKHSIKLQEIGQKSEGREKNTFYLFSDGFQDQFGGDNNKKFMVSRFHELLTNIHRLPIHLQKDMLENQLMKWKGVYEQTDDVLIIGFQLA